MTKQQIIECYDLIKKYKEEEDETEQQIIRNQIFSLLSSHMERWIKSILSGRGHYLDQQEILSQSWDCFEFCLRHYKIDGLIPVPNHFYSYSKFYLSMSTRKDFERAKKETTDILNMAGQKRGLFGERKKIIINSDCDGIINEKDSLLQVEDSFLPVYEHIDELKSFRALLPSEYVSVFDDAIMSMVANHTQNLQRLNQTTLSYSKYQEVKKVFKIIIDFLLTK